MVHDYAMHIEPVLSQSFPHILTINVAHLKKIVAIFEIFDGNSRPSEKDG